MTGRKKVNYEEGGNCKVGGWNVRVRLNGKLIIENWSCFIKSDIANCKEPNGTTDYEVNAHDDYSTNWQVDNIRITG